MWLWGLGHCQTNIYLTCLIKHYAAFFLSVYSVCLNHKVTLGEEIVQWGNFKYPYSQLLVLYRLLKSNTQLLLCFIWFSYTEHKKPSSAAVSFSNLCEENNNAKSAGERLYGLTSGIADNWTRGSDAGCFGAPSGRRSAGAAAALRLSSSGCLHLSPSLRRLPPPQAIWQKCAATLSSLFFYLEDDNSSYCCYYKEWHFVLFSLGENVLKLTELCLGKKLKNLRWLQQNVWDEEESVVGLLIPMCTSCASAVCEQPVDEQKTESYQFGICTFWTKIKAESRDVFIFCVALSALRFAPAEKQNPCMTFCGLTLHQSQAEDSLKTGKQFFLLFLFFGDSESHPGALSQTLRSHLPGSTAGQERRLKSCFLVIHEGLKTPSDLCVVAPYRHGRSHRPGQICLFHIHWLHWLFFNVICAFFLQRKKEHKEKKS